MIVLSWIRKESYQLKTFVANRIATIQEMTSSEQWRYVATEDNPADFVSRGMDSLKLKTCELWWNGPKFLMSNQYPQRQIPVAVIKDPAFIEISTKEEFKVEMNGIQNSAIKFNSRVKTLNPFIDTEGILVGGRLKIG
ncbi:uncharacterized protein TNCV_3811431 [Trichonephila clavipes]|nr:uncharacterized protein TNCV_3811431 [Trichonephila clavipes]